MDFVDAIKDPIYGVIPITECERDLLRLRLLNRLRNIKQLGLAFLAFPGANHTRFEHSIGTMHVASLMAQSLRLREHEIEFVRIAALLHDVGHPPFSHSVEYAFQMFPSVGEHFTHTKVTEDRIGADAQLAAALDKHHETFHATDLAALAVGKFKNRMFNKIIDGPIDADKVDYIFRDNYHCGFPVGFDIDNLAQILVGDEEEGQMKVKKEGRAFAEQLLIGRYHLITGIHHDRKNRLANCLLAHTLRDALAHAANISEVTNEMFNIWGDADLLAFLKDKAKFYWRPLDEFIHGKENFTELANYTFRGLSPYSRYNASLLARRLHSLPVLSRLLQRWCKSRLLVDLYTADPPDLPLWIGDSNVLDIPLGSGLVESSLSEVNVAIYGFRKLRESAFDLRRIVQAYAKLDPSLTEDEARDEIDKLYGRDKVGYALHHISEIVLNQLAAEMRQDQIFRSDLPLLLLLALETAFSKAIGQYRIYIRSLSEFAHLLKDMQVGIEEYVDEVYNFDKDRLPAELELDIRSLSIFGLIYRNAKARRFKEGFTSMYRLRAAGWARGYWLHNLSSCEIASRVQTSFMRKLARRISEQKTEYRQYFKLLEQSRKSYIPILEDRIKELEWQLPLKVVK